MSNKNQETENTTRRDSTDMGVPMLPADPNAPKRSAMPEDAADPNTPTRGDYSGRVLTNPHQSTADADAPEGEKIGRVEKQKAPRLGE